MKRSVALLLVSWALAAPAGAQTLPEEHSANLTRIARIPYAGGTDLAFQGDYVIAGDWDGADAGFRIIDVSKPAAPKVVGHFLCNGSQNDVSVYGNLVFMSVDGRRATNACDAPAGGGKAEGVRVVDITNMKSPKMLQFVQTECGSHTHTLLPQPEAGRALIYVQSAGPGMRTETTDGRDAECNRDTHTRNSVIEVPLATPKAARVLSTPSVAYGGSSLQAGTPFVGCHDATLFMPGKIAGAACYDETQLWDLSNPAGPTILSHIPSSLEAPLDIHHTTGFSWDGKVMVLGDEAGGGSGPACTGLPDDRLGALFFYDVSDPANPILKSRFSLPRPRVAACTAHNFNVVPLKGRNILVSAWYTGGINVIDFTDPAAPREIAYYAQIPDPTGEVEDTFDTWSAYWYNGFIYVNGFDGFHVFELDDAAVAGAARLDRLNPQTQLAWERPAPAPLPADTKPRVLGVRKSPLPSTGAGVAWPLTLGVLGVAAVAAGFLRRPT